MGDNEYNPTHDDGVLDASNSDSDLEEFSVSLELEKTGERGSGYHTRNDPASPFQRSTVTERRGIIEIRCKSREIIHGNVSTDDEERATLLVYDVHLDTTRRSRRVLSANIEFEFSSSEPGSPAPEVQIIAPAGRMTLQPSSQEESVTHGSEVNIGTGQLPVDIGGAVKWEKTVSRTTSDDARVTGYIFSDDYGRGVGASWVLHENRTTNSGVPTFLRCAILLNRGCNDDNFQCNLRIKAEADWKTEMGRLMGSTPRDDPLLFDPALAPTNKLCGTGYDLDNLGSIDLDRFVKIYFDQAYRARDKTE